MTAEYLLTEHARLGSIRSFVPAVFKAVPD